MAIDFYGRLAQQVAAELDACIGCHLCMRACPLPSAPLIQIGEMNDAIGGGPMSQRMLSFTLDCTQCGACVPVCPADLSRMRMVLSAKLRVEEPHPDTPVFLDARGSTVYSGWTVGSLAAQLASYPLFQGVSVPTIRAAIPRMRLRQYLPGETILREGQFSNALRIVVAGTADMRVRVADGREIPLMTVTAGHFFGELSILSNRPDPATMTTAGGAVLLELSDATLRRLMAESEPFRAQLDALHARSEVHLLVRRAELFRAVPSDLFSALIERHEVRVFERGELIAREGEASASFFFVMHGFVKVSRRAADGAERVITYYQDGGYDPDWSVLAGGPRATTLTANTRCEIVLIPNASLGRLLATLPPLAERLGHDARRHMQLVSHAAGPPPMAGSGHLTALLDEGVLQSHALLVIDKTRCIDCNNCVDACVRRHGHSRLERKGLSVGPYLIATACRHCDDPLCLLCPVDGIVRAPDGQIVINDNCIGCGACAARCPYDNIRMGDRRPPGAEQPRGGLWQLIRDLGRPRGHGAITFEQNDLRAKVAVKCDLCVGYRDGPACVRNCPTGAAFRADGASFFGSGEQISLLASVERRRPTQP